MILAASYVHCIGILDIDPVVGPQLIFLYGGDVVNINMYIYIYFIFILYFRILFFQRDEERG